jgi:hypothetical protein
MRIAGPISGPTFFDRPNVLADWTELKVWNSWLLMADGCD